MKRIRIWLNGFSLIQQLIAVGLLTIMVFGVFFMTFFNRNIDGFVQNQMLSYLHRYESHYISSNSVSGFLYKDSNVNSYIYSVGSDKYISNIDDDNKGFLSSINPSDMIGSGSDGDIIYSITSFDEDNYLLISIISDEYRMDFKNALMSGVINFTIIVIILLFTLFLLWVFSIISPLNSIRNYIDRLRQGEDPELIITRSDEIGEIAESLTSMNEELKKQQRIREEMIQNISHDLKTPIATIKSYSESIKDGIYPYDTLEKSVDVIIENANRLEKKAYNLNTFNKLEYLKDSDESTNMSKVIEKAILSIEAIRNDIEVETNIDSSVEFHGAEEPWQTVVENLLDNALRYARKKVVITLEFNFLEVYNDGELMSKDRIDKLFKPYEKGTKGNFGLGLSIVKRICDTYGYVVLGENTHNGVVFRIYSNKPQKRNNKKKEKK